MEMTQTTSAPRCHATPSLLRRAGAGALIMGLLAVLLSTGTLHAQPNSPKPASRPAAAGEAEEPILSPQDDRWANPPPPWSAENAENHLDVVYLPQRIAGGEQDRFVKLNIHIPKGKGPFPAVFCVHGGGYTGGDKDHIFHGSSSPSRANMQRLVDGGFVVVNVNYLLGRGIKPQVYWDFRSAVRFIRANAETYRVDPGRIGAWGHSAGGWLSGSAGFTTADDLFTTNVSFASGRLGQRGDRFRLPFDAPEPPYPEFSSRLTCIAADFWENTEFLSPDDPAILGYTGLGTTHILTDHATRGRVDFTSLEVQDPKTRGKNKLHGPNGRALVKGPGFDEPINLTDATHAWLSQQLQRAPRTIPPEARPNRRVFTEQALVTLIPASPDAQIRYTLDGSDPSADSPRYDGPFTIRSSTTIRAMAIRRGERPSAITQFRFTLVPQPPVRIVAPQGPLLPAARVGKPYELTFKASTPDAVFGITGHLDPIRPASPVMDRLPRDPFALQFDRSTARLTGTPVAPGLYTIQVFAARSAVEPAEGQAFVLKVEP